MTAHPSP